MRNHVQLIVMLLVLTMTLACGSANDQPAGQPQPPQGNALATEAPASGAATPATTPGTEMRATPAPVSTAAARAVAPASTMMPMDVPSGTQLHLTLETPVSSETAT